MFEVSFDLLKSLKHIPKQKEGDTFHHLPRESEGKICLCPRNFYRTRVPRNILWELPIDYPHGWLIKEMQHLLVSSLMPGSKLFVALDQPHYFQMRM